MTDPRCGTYAGAKLHGRRKEKSCEPCRLAANAYERERKARGNARRGKRTDPTDRFWIKVDKTETCWNWTAAMKENGYGTFWDGDRLTYAHRFAYETSSGPIPEGMHIDHRCHNRKCVNPGHLRVVTAKQNLENAGVLRTDNTSGFRGVLWDKSRGAWLARVTHHRRDYFAGYFSNPEDAAKAAADKRNELFTHNDLDRNAA